MKLNEWLVRNHLNVHRFAKNHNLCGESLYKYVKGGIPRSTVAVKIVKATGGEVSLEDLGLSDSLISKVREKQRRLKKKLEKEKAKRAAKKAQALSDP